jgi:Zn-dependent metalloprotease
VLERDLATGTVRFLKGENLSAELDGNPTFKASRAAGDSEGVARAFLAHYRTLLRLDDPATELVKRRIDVDRSGASHVRFAQIWRGLDVLGAELIVHLDRERRVVLVNGAYAPTPHSVDTKPSINATQARAAAAKAAGGEPCSTCPTELVVFADRHASPRLAWRVAPPAGQIHGEEILVAADDSDVLRRLPVALSGRPKPAGESP